MRFGALAYLLEAGPLRWLVLLSASVFALLGIADSGLFASSPAWAICNAAGLTPNAVAPSAVAAWVLMIAAMMPPLLALPVGHVWVSVFPQRRVSSLAALGLGYAAAWLAAGAVLIPTGVALVRLPGAATCIGRVALALAWSCSPPAQAMRNRCHRLRPIAPFGARRLRDCLSQGAASGLACVGACWPWMLVPAAAGAHHLASMALVTPLLFLERLAPAAPPYWRWPPAVGVAIALA